MARDHIKYHHREDQLEKQAKGHFRQRFGCAFFPVKGEHDPVKYHSDREKGCKINMTCHQNKEDNPCDQAVGNFPAFPVKHQQEIEEQRQCPHIGQGKVPTEPVDLRREKCYAHRGEQSHVDRQTCFCQEQIQENRSQHYGEKHQKINDPDRMPGSVGKILRDGLQDPYQQWLRLGIEGNFAIRIIHAAGIQQRRIVFREVAGIVVTQYPVAFG